MNELDPIRAGVRSILAGVVADSARIDSLEPNDNLFALLPELDSIGCVNVVIAIEERYNFEVRDHEVDEALFASIESLSRYVHARQSEAPPPGCADP